MFSLQEKIFVDFTAKVVQKILAFFQQTRQLWRAHPQRNVRYISTLKNAHAAPWVFINNCFLPKVHKPFTVHSTQWYTLGISKGKSVNANSHNQTSMITVKWCWAWQMRQAIKFGTTAYFNLSFTLWIWSIILGTSYSHLMDSYIADELTLMRV